MIEVAGLTKTFGARRALRGVDLEVGEGELLTVVGPNGAGKTTLVRVLATLTRPTAGRVRIGGIDVVRDADAVRRQIGFVSHRTLLYDDLSGEENLQFYGRLYGLRDLRRRVSATLEQVGLTHRRRDPVRTYSRGMQQRLAIGRAVLHRPRVMLLDEPYTGLDPNAASTLRDQLRSVVGDGQTILMTTHDLSLGVSSSSRVAILSDGRIAFLSDARCLDDAAFRRVYEQHTQAARS